MTPWLRRSLIAALLMKGLLLLAGTTGVGGDSVALDYADRMVNLAILVAGGVWSYRLTKLARAGLLWRVSRKLILSYILIGAVPILLLITFSSLAFLLVFFDVSSYLVQSRFAALTAEATTLARTTLLELERASGSQRQNVIQARRASLQRRFPGMSLSVVRTEGRPMCGASPAPVTPPARDTLPPWVSCRGFAGFVAPGSNAGPGTPRAEPANTNPLQMVARAAVLSDENDPEYAVVVDLAVESSLAAGGMQGTGIDLGSQRRRSVFNSATFITYTDWNTGSTHLATLPMSVQVGTLYGWLGSAQGNGSFNRVLMYVLLGVGLLLLVIEVVALGNGLALARSITASVDDLFGGTARVKSGDFDRAIAVRSDDQLGELAISFNDMTDRIRGLLVEQNEKRRLEEELRIARAMQMSLLPQGPLSVAGLSVAGLCVPAREVGGDYYDFLPLGGRRFGLIIADVSGKGTSAAFYMAELKGLMLSLSRIHTSPRALLLEADRIISKHLNSHSFITMTYAIIDLDAGLLTCARAGHTPFIRIPSVLGDGVRIAEVLAPDGMVLGLNLDNGERFERLLQEVTIPLACGDLFFFFTDGISEAMDREGDCFGEERLTLLLQLHADLSTESIRDHVVGEIHRFVDGQPQHDDITLIILKVA